jgi:hypothetical protein
VGKNYLITPFLVDQLSGNLFASEQKISTVSNSHIITFNEKQMMDMPFLLLEGILLDVGF